ncbi:phage head-tail adapter protein [Listeria ilorinensis]|uniref:phage head-tail adapter protein n=1 Tax=Listeria ilorinensis TaxID=2867439 RepID=UPI001EF6BD86|nr:phage head-tail adapter protein [Listeria ilorinensis]
MKPFKYTSPDIQSADLRTPVVFYGAKPNKGPEPGETTDEKLYACFGDVYNPSAKDLSILEGTETEEAVTVKIRDTRGGYLPSTSDYLVLDDWRYRGKEFAVKSVGPDLENNNYIKVIAGVVTRASNIHGDG